jgi:hypothetical protein
MARVHAGTAEERLYQTHYVRSLKRVKRRGLDAASAARVARVVARRVLERTKAPEFKSDKALSALVTALCRELAEGRSFYDLMKERPYLLVGRIDRLVAAASRVNPPVPSDVSFLAQRVAKIERLSGAAAVLLVAVALVTIGPWYALAVGFVVAVGSEIYAQVGMPASIRVLTARIRLPRYLGVAALVTICYLGYRWTRDTAHPFPIGVGLAVAALFIAFVVPGFTLAVLAGRRERRWRLGLERRLVRALKDDAWEDDEDAATTEDVIEAEDAGAEDAGAEDAGAPEDD